MTKSEFLDALRKSLSGLPKEDLEEKVNFFSEMIDDRIEDGISEEEAVATQGSVEDIKNQILEEYPLTKLAKEKVKPKKKMNALEVTFLIVTSPIWLSLLIAVAAVIFSVYVSLWAVIVSLWSIFASFIGCTVGGVLSGILFAFKVSTLHGFLMIGASLVCAGLSIFSFYGCTAATKGIVWLTKKFGLFIKNCLIGKEAA